MGSNPLKPCPSSPNCVSTVGPVDKRNMAPISYTGSTEEALSKLLGILKSAKGAKVVENRGLYIHATFTSSFWRFVDDVEFWIDGAARLIHFRSASRVGYYDFGANRRRMEEIRAQFLSGPS